MSGVAEVYQEVGSTAEVRRDLLAISSEAVLKEQAELTDSQLFFDSLQRGQVTPERINGEQNPYQNVSKPASRKRN